MDYRLELVVVPVSDVDRAKEFYERAGFRLDVDHRAGEDRVVQPDAVRLRLLGDADARRCRGQRRSGRAR